MRQSQIQYFNDENENNDVESDNGDDNDDTLTLHYKYYHPREKLILFI